MGTDAPLFDDTAPPADAGPPTPCVLWCRPDQAQLARRLARRANLEYRFAGSPERGRGGELARSLGAEHAGDLRAALTAWDAPGAEDNPVGLALLLDAGTLGAGDDDAQTLADLGARGVRVVSLDPIPASATELGRSWTDGPEGARPVDRIRLAGLVSRMGTLHEAMEHRDSFGAVRSIGLSLCCGAGEGSLGGLLASGLELLIAELGTPELVDASHVGPRSDGGLHPASGDSIRGLHADLSVLLRFEGGQSATMLLSDRAGAWDRRVTLLGQGGRLDITDDGFEWTGNQGESVDRHEAPHATGDASTPHAVRVLARDIAAALSGEPDRGTRGGRGPIDPGPVLACAQTVLLSCRTGQAERPETITRMLHA
ncbi:MAG: hypothetical protein ACF8Q5_03090 [Phycisphaerales bacterium JB040]